ncbi:NAD(P)/FAD-dependent oxidoreductase [Phycisphaerales bacterium AB-hyl4]|uniref:NAD(P)/FAD-dependent oxidoreductase n=1 Tax=Natronomicrosphaera hydrolytica TaxID=3242702 RepID=A0ABV4U4Y3_9BACT
MTTHHDQYDIAIVGVGAAGMMAAIFAGRSSPKGTRIVALDGATKLGAKILVAGGGRCNVTHDVVYPRDYFGASAKQVQRILKTFTVKQTVAFFEQLNVRLKREDTGKLFPTTDQARTVLDALLKAMADAKVELRTGWRVTAIDRAPQSPGFIIRSDEQALHARRVILATGGKSLPKTGSDGFGYELVKRLGHTVTPTWPALVPLMLPKGYWLTELSGIAADVTLTLAAASGKAMHKQAGAMLVTHFGISGPAAMDISRHWVAAHNADANVQLTANLTGDLEFVDVEAIVQEEAQRRPKATVTSVPRCWLPERFAQAVVRHGAGIDPGTPLGHLKREDRRRLVHALTALPLPVQRDRGYLFAEVTAGGVPLDEVDLKTMASKRCDGLHLCGEILNVDGRIGGYNFQWAWCTGRLAGEAAALRG